MVEWIKRRRSMALDQGEARAEAAQRRADVMSGEYQWLYQYLERRYAVTVVLTFAEIEDLLGFTLPDVARLRQDWWTNADPGLGRSHYSHSWIVAGRTATPNLLAQTVVFERAS